MNVCLRGLDPGIWSEGGHIIICLNKMIKMEVMIANIIACIGAGIAKKPNGVCGFVIRLDGNVTE